MNIEVAKTNDNIKSVEVKLAMFETKLQNEISELQVRMDAVESQPTPVSPFDPEVSVIITGLRYHDGEEILARAKELIANGLGEGTLVMNAADMFLFWGDFNGRIGDLSDIIDGKDNDVPPRKVLDNVKKGHAEALMEFVRDGKLVILNGRVNPENDNFTFISSRDKSVVDYMMAPQDCMRLVDSFRIDGVSDLMTKYGSPRFLSPTCKSPDHSLLTMMIKCSYDPTNPVRADGTYNDSMSKSRNVYQYHDRYDENLSSPVWQAAIQNVIAQLERRQVQQSELDIAYNDLCKNIYNELDNTVGYKIACNKLKKTVKVM